MTDFKCKACGQVTKEEQDIVGSCKNKDCEMFDKTVVVAKSLDEPIEIKHNGKTVRITIEIM